MARSNDFNIKGADSTHDILKRTAQRVKLTRTGQPTKIDLYDDGGDVAVKQQQSADESLRAGAARDIAPPPALPAIPQYTHGGDAGRSRPAAGVKQPSYMPGGGPEAPAPQMPRIDLSNVTVPKFDTGGDVEGDNDHQLAVLQDGERVLTPEENAQYKQEHPDEAAAHARPTQTAQLIPTPKEFNQGDHSHDAVRAALPLIDTADAEKQAQQRAVDADRKSGAGKGIAGIAQIGLANIHAKQLGLNGETEAAAPGSITDKMTAPADFTPRKIDLSSVSPDNAAPKSLIPTPEAPNVSSERGADFKTRLAQLQQDHAKALAERTPDGKLKADYIQEQIDDLHKNNPWGSEGNHKGILGKIAHIGAGIGNIAGNIVAPSTMALIPGTALNKQIRENSLQNRIHLDEDAVAAEDKSSKTAGPDWKVSTGAVGPNGRVMLENSKTGEVKEAPEGFTPYDKPAHLGDQATYIAQWYKDHPDAPKSTENDDKAIEAYGTAKAAAAQENKAKGKIYYYDTPNGRQGYTYSEAQAAGLKPEEGYAVSAQQAEKDRKANDTYQGLKDQMWQYRKNISNSVGQLLPTDVDNMASMIEAVESPDYVSKIVTGIVDDFYGKPVTGYNEKLMKGALTKKAYDNMSPAARQLVADYFTTLMAHFGNVKATLGQVPRNEKLITTEMNMIPKPYLDAEEAEPAFKNYTAQIERNNAHNVRFGTQKTTTNSEKATPVDTNAQVPQMTDEEKKLVGSITMPDGSHPAQVHKGPKGIIVWSGNAGDPWIDPTTGKEVR